MTKLHVLLAISLLGGAALAGCASDDDADTTTTTPSATTPATTTPATTPTSTTPAVTTPTVPTNVTPPTVPPTVTTPTPTPVANATPTIDQVVVLASPDRLPAAGEANVCARVEGSGKVPHVALHWDRVSHPNSTSFAEYVGGAVYPDGRGSPDPNGYPLPGVFCFVLPVDETLYYRAHALAPPALPGVLSVEKTIAFGAAPELDFAGDLPEVWPAGSNVTLCWTTPMGALPHTAIHWDTVSHPNSTAFGDYKGGAVYADNGTSAAATGPGPLCTSLKMPPSGAVYFRAHALNATAGLNNLSVERNVVVGRAVSVLGPVPASAAAGSDVLVCWRAEGAGPSPHTALHWDRTSHPNATAFNEYAGGAFYPGNATAAVPVTLPGPFCTNVKMPDTGALHFRAHLLVPGPATGTFARNELSDEVSIAVA